MNVVMSWFHEPLQAGFFVRGIVAAVLVMVGGAVLGFGVLTRRSAYLGQGVSQSMLAGVAAGATMGASPTLSAFAGALIAAVLISSLSKVKGLGPEAAVAIVSSAALSAGVVLISADRTRAVNLNNLLFGNVLGVTWTEIITLTFAVTGACFFSVWHGRRLALSAIAPSVAVAHGVNVRRLELARVVTLAMITAAAVQVVGVTLVVAALVLPAGVGAALTRTLGGAHLVAVGTAVITGVLGLYVSYWYDLASGPAVVLVGTLFYLLTLSVARVHSRQ